MHGRRARASDVFGALLLFLLLFVISSLRSTSAADDDSLLLVNTDHSLCNESTHTLTLYHRVTVTRRESYTETYWHSYGGYRETRINYRDGSYTKWEAMEICCPGYEPDGPFEVAEGCVPVCPSYCTNGQCESPNKCTCHPGYEESTNATTGFSECAPHCSSGCHGGRCTEPEICSCDAGFTPTEDQQSCRALCDGVRGDDQLTGCGAHATCVAPDTCRCDDGYAELLAPRTTAATWTMMTNKTTSADFLSSTRPSIVNRIVCAPVCQPECGRNARCTGPNLCECDSGYAFAGASASNDSLTTSPRAVNSAALDCTPVCEPACVNGVCSGPNECSCLAGYEPHRALGAILCEPACRDGCINGRCAGPNRCECAAGYRPLATRLGKVRAANICEPVCVTECPNGRCFAPGRCHCDRGYAAMVAANGTTIGNVSIADPPVQETCRPICEPGCAAGLVCTGPNRCDVDKSTGSTGSSAFDDTEWTTTGDKAELKSGNVAGSVIGAIVGLVLAAGLGGTIYLLLRRFRRNRSLRGAVASNNPMLERNNPESPFASMKSSQDL